MHAGVIISLPFGIFKLAIANKQADDPELTNNPYFFPNNFDILFSNSIEYLPNPANHPFWSDSTTLEISSSPYDWKELGAYQILFFF